MPEPIWKEGFPYAQAALAKGMPMPMANYFGNMLNDPNLRQLVPDLMRQTTESGWPVDPLGYALGAYNQGDQSVAAELVEAATAPRPYPPAWEELLSLTPSAGSTS